MTAPTITPEALRPRVEGDFANEQIKQAIMARLFEEQLAPAKIGRFTVIRELGRGGTGVVYAAYDEQLERKIAVKLLHEGSSEADARARLLREAQAMARLSHPHIVSVHEVGTHHGQVYIAMEFVHGLTLGAWLKKQPRTWRETVEVFRQAGSGLAAAHDAGLVHRDFKPANVMVGDDGRVRVLDFGLARADGDPQLLSDLERTRDSRTALRALDTSITVTGSLVGTPAYMAPEQFLGERVDPRTDQFAFCVALYEALLHERPFPGDTLPDLMRSVLTGKPRDPAGAVRLPRALRAAVLRGLQLRPDARHPTMEALLTAVDRVAEPRRGAWLAAAGLSTTLAVGAGLAYHSSSMGQVCEDRGAADIAAVWTPERAAAIGAALRAVDPEADTAWPRAAARFDAYALAWSEGAADACVAAEVRREQSQALYDLRRACLDGRLRAFQSALDLFDNPEAILAVRAADIAAGLEPLETCADPHELQSQIRPPDELARTVADLRAELARAEAHRRASKLDDALAALDALSPRLPPDFAPLHAEVELSRGRLLTTRGRHKEALTSLQAAYFTALAASYDRLAIAAAIDLITLTGVHLADYVASERHVRHARALLARTGSPTLRAALADAQGQVDLSTGRYADARAHFRRALELYTQAGLQDSPDAAVDRRLLADATASLGDLDTAQTELDAALATLQKEYCERHPDIAYALDSAGKLAMRRGDLDRAIALFEKARGNIAEVVGEDSHVYMHVTSNAVEALLLRRDFDQADALLRRALALATPTGALPTDGRPLHPDIFRMRISQAHLLEHRADLAGAEAILRATFADAERAWGSDEPYLAQSLIPLVDLLRTSGRLTDALPLAERAYTLASSRGDRVHPSLRYDSAFQLARTLAELGHNDRAESLAREAQSLASSAGDTRVATSVTTWLSDHRNG